MLEVKNEQLGNFGFLLDFNQKFLFEFAQLAESNLYVNKRLCAAYIRQLTESFFDTVIDKEKIKIKKTANDGREPVAFILDKQIAIEKYFNDRNFRRPEYGKRVFPKYPGFTNRKDSRLACPEGEGDNCIGHSLVDSDKKTLYVWDFIRRLGNAGSHAVLSEDNKRWLEEKYIIVALQQLCIRMGIYFYGINNKDSKVKYSLERCSLASRVVFYPQENGKTISVERQGILPGYVEKKYYTVMPKSGICKGKTYWENYINKYSIIRRYEIMSGVNVRNYLLQSQKAYLILQQTGNLEGIASYAVLADLRNSADYYVTSYEFDIEPLDLCEETLRECGVYSSEKNLLLLQLRFIKIMMNLSENHIYHRNLTHNSIKLCKLNDCEYELRIIDFELVKLYEKEDELSQETVYKFINKQTQLMNEFAKESGKYDPYGNIRQYGAIEWNENTTELEYQREQRRRAGMILCNMLCPVHFDNSKSFHTVASLDEICEQGNFVTKDINIELAKKIFDVANRLMNESNFLLDQAYSTIEDIINEY